MSITNSSLESLSKRDQSLRKLTSLFTKIEFLELSQEDFSTEDLHHLSIYAEYSIHPVFSSKELSQIYIKLSQKYWTNFENLDFSTSTKRVNDESSIIQNDLKTQLPQNQSIQQLQIQVQIEQNNQIQENSQHSQHSENEKQTEAFQEVKQAHPQIKITKNYHQIKKLLLQFDYESALQNEKIGPKIHLLNSWTSVPTKLPNFIQKKPVQLPNKMDSVTYLENLKFGKQFRKDSTTSLNNRSIILGKNESTQTKQMKHMLKVQAKTNFVEQKQKEESKLDNLEKKSIELNYLLNVITKDFFNDFFEDILKILRENEGSIKILCEKIIDKVKEEHNFIEIYVDLIKKLCKSSISENENEPKRFNELQIHFVSILQKSFTKLIEFIVEPSSSNFNEYKYQKQMMGMSQFIGKLIKEKVLSRKIFKVCFWQIVYRYVQKVKENPDHEIVNECLIEAIVTISDSMTNVELLKLIQKEKLSQETKQMDEVIEINKFQRMIMALVNPNDEDHIKREKQYNDLIDSIKVEEYPHILSGLMQIFVSKRMKLKFLVENWQQKIEALKTSTLQDIVKMEQKYLQAEPTQAIIQEVEEDLIEYDRELKEFVKEIKHDPSIINHSKGSQAKSKDLLKYENLIKKYIQSEASHSRKVLKLLIIEFLKQFADSKDHQIVINRISYFINFVDSLGLKNSNQNLIEIICEDELQNLMIIECDYPFLVEGLCHLLVHLIEKVPIQKQKVFEKMENNFSRNDQDMVEFYEKIHDQLTKILGQKDEALED